MKKLALILLIPLVLSGCEAEGLASVWNSVFTETTEAYENVKSEVETRAEAAKETYDKLHQAAEDVGEAADAVSDALDSLQAIGDDEDEDDEEVEETTEEETEETDADV